jgi:hypothetical protein
MTVRLKETQAIAKALFYTILQSINSFMKAISPSEANAERW